uniref:DUF2834 domain-containing protein n=1 Tax=uncultured Micrococcales bacterium TaxID=1920814 RepID=A0A871Y7L9_9MICO|nr:hypothetical protein HULAa3G5_00026 [uncultured Micrococcales bacterium]
MENRNTKIAVSKLILISIYLVLALIGLVGTWYFNFEFFALNTDVSYLEAWFANPASSSAAVDIIVVALMGSVFMLVEGWRMKLQWVWILIPLSFFIALAFTFPLFLAIREIRLTQLQRPERVI